MLAAGDGWGQEMSEDAHALVLWWRHRVVSAIPRMSDTRKQLQGKARLRKNMSGQKAKYVDRFTHFRTHFFQEYMINYTYMYVYKRTYLCTISLWLARCTEPFVLFVSVLLRPAWLGQPLKSTRWLLTLLLLYLVVVVTVVMYSMVAVFTSDVCTDFDNNRTRTFSSSSIDSFLTF